MSEWFLVFTILSSLGSTTFSLPFESQLACNTFGENYTQSRLEDRRTPSNGGSPTISVNYKCQTINEEWKYPVAFHQENDQPNENHDRQLLSLNTP